MVSSLGYILSDMDKKGIIINLFIVISLFSFSGGIYAQDSNKQSEPGDVFSLSPAVDIPLLAAGSILFVSELFIEPATGEQQSREDLFILDRYSIFDYNPGLDRSCDFLFASSLLLPVASVIGADLETSLETGVMLLEALLLTYSVKDIMKDLIPRYRPYTYLSDPVDDDYMNSFPSGHTAAVFTVCSFSACLFAGLYPDSEWKLPVIIGASAIAAATGTLRILSGNHFITDVAAGAVIGSLFGIGVPLLHKTGLYEDSGIDLGFSAGRQPALTVSYRMQA